jgi:hypothetical protein
MRLVHVLTLGCTLSTKSCPLLVRVTVHQSENSPETSILDLLLPSKNLASQLMFWLVVSIL